MNKIKNWIVIALCALTFITSTTYAQNAVSTNAVVSTVSTGLYNANEFGVSLGSGYVLDKAKLFKSPYALNASAGAFWFPWRNIGFSADVPFYSTKGASVSEVQLGVIARLPLATTIPVLKSISPYVGLSGVYAWDDSAKFAYIAKAGVEYRFNHHFGLFGEGQYRNENITINKGQNSLVAGLHLVF